EDVDGEPLQMLVVNSIRKSIKAVAVKSPYFGDRRKAFMDDLAVVTGATVVDKEVGQNLSETTLEQLGTARRITVTKDETVIVDGAGTAEDLDTRRNQIRSDIERTDSTWDREKLEERLAKLSGGVAVIRAGGATETEVNERKLRVEDAINAARAAAQEGVIAGGGSVLVQIAAELDEFAAEFEGDKAVGVKALARALRRPAYWIADNAGLDGAVVVSKIAERANGEGYNAATGVYGNLLEQGIIDPVKVTHSAVVNATSVARMVLTTETAVVDKPAVAAAAAAGHGHHHH
ncbi:chaperonin GroEL, partial [Corynebacterium sp.]|uniref:chaperonin GroEL n=1 Tax=Corynebacterium sp. TaxID=1720 RepID=UPI002649758A